MKFTLDTFYQSKEWRRFRDVVINERMTPDGFVLDEVTGKPILKQYDIILHHKIFLTPDNVNDVTVSLNPDNIQIVSHKTHNRLHNKLGYKRQEVYLVYGCPLSGKTEYVFNNMMPGDLLIDIDRLWAAVSGKKFFEKYNTLNSIVFGLRNYLFECVQFRRGKWQNAYIIGGFPMISERERLCKRFGAREVYIESTREQCLTRLDALNDGRDKAAFTQYINEWWERFNPGDSPPR